MSIDSILMIVSLLFAVTFHEVAHGYAALRFGDHTARLAGRLSLNPIRHIDPFGSILLPGLLIFSGSPVLFGYAKPVPVNFYNLRNPELGTLVVSIAGIGVNLALAVAAGITFQGLAFLFPEMSPGSVIATISRALVNFTIINVILAIFNLLPIPPLDGSKVLAVLLPPGARQAYEKIGPFGIVILVAFMMSGALNALFLNVIAPIAYFLIGA